MKAKYGVSAVLLLVVVLVLVILALGAVSAAAAPAEKATWWVNEQSNTGGFGLPDYHINSSAHVKLLPGGSYGHLVGFFASHDFLIRDHFVAREFVDGPQTDFHEGFARFVVSIDGAPYRITLVDGGEPNRDDWIYGDEWSGGQWVGFIAGPVGAGAIQVHEAK
jgi:hypothetical protein